MIKRSTALACACLLSLLAPGASAAPSQDTEQEAGFAVKFRDDVIPYRIFGVYVLPGETVDIETVFTEGRGSITLQAADGAVEQTDTETWKWTAPEEPGLVKLRLGNARSGDSIVLNAFVKTRFDHTDERLNGYRIGEYETEPLRGNPVYDRPRGFIEVTPDNRDRRVAPNFTLGQFLCKEKGGPPDYLVLRERLLLKLETILGQVRDMGVDADTLFIMSGFRTPYYNRAIGNTTEYSRHLYGGAADIFVDTDGNGRMDDLDGNGVIDRDDAEVLADMVRDNVDETWYRPFIGGLGVYGPAPHRGPFVHVDVRGFKARW